MHLDFKDYWLDLNVLNLGFEKPFKCQKYWIEFNLNVLIFRMSKNGNGEGTPPVIENAHIFQEYTYKKITPCDICSQILRGKKMAHGR